VDAPDQAIRPLAPHIVAFEWTNEKRARLIEE